MKDQIKKSGTLLASIGTIGGFISDVLTPLGPFTKWIFIIFCIVTIILLIGYFRNISFGKKYLPHSLILTIVFGSLFLINGGSKNGILGDNIDGISSMQRSLFSIQETVERVEGKVDIIDQKLDLGFEKIAELIQSNNPIENPNTAKDFIVNAYLYKSSGLLNKSQISFEEYFRLSEQYKIDILLDYCDVFESNNGFVALKSRLELFPKNEITKVVKLIRTSINEQEVYLQLINTDIELDEKLIKWAVLTLGADVIPSLEPFSANNFEYMYYNFKFHLDIGYNCEEVYHYFFNNLKAKDLINTNPLTKKPFYFHLVDYLSLSGYNIYYNAYYPKDGISGQYHTEVNTAPAKSAWYSEEYKNMAIELDSLYLSKREEGWFR